MNAVGSSVPSARARELDTDDGRRDARSSTGASRRCSEAGDLLLAGFGEERIAAELVKVLAGKHPGANGRRGADRVQVARARRRRLAAAGACRPEGAGAGRRHRGRVLIDLPAIERAWRRSPAPRSARRSSGWRWTGRPRSGSSSRTCSRSARSRSAAPSTRSGAPGRRDGARVVTVSAGNMAQGVAWAARELGVPATIVAPEQAPRTKLDAIERLGGRS